VVGGCALAALGGGPSVVAAQSPLEAFARLTVEGQGIEQALRMLGRSAGVSLVYSPDLLPASEGVRCACQDVTVRQALERILQGTGLTFRSRGTLIRIVPLEPRAPRTQTGCIIRHV